MVSHLCFLQVQVDVRGPAGKGGAIHGPDRRLRAGETDTAW